MAAIEAAQRRRAMFWRLVLQALRLRRQRVAVVFGALAVGAAIVTAMAAVYFDINVKMSQELRSFGANFYVGPGGPGRMPEADYDAEIIEAIVQAVERKPKAHRFAGTVARDLLEKDGPQPEGDAPTPFFMHSVGG